MIEAPHEQPSPVLRAKPSEGLATSVSPKGSTWTIGLDPLDEPGALPESEARRRIFDDEPVGNKMDLHRSSAPRLSITSMAEEELEMRRTQLDRVAQILHGRRRAGAPAAC